MHGLEPIEAVTEETFSHDLNQVNIGDWLSMKRDRTDDSVHRLYLDVHRCFFASVVLILLLARSTTGELSTLINEMEALVTVEVDEDVLFDEVYTEVHELSHLDRVDNLNFIFDSVIFAHVDDDEHVSHDYL